MNHKPEIIPSLIAGVVALLFGAYLGFLAGRELKPPVTYTERVVVYPDGDCPCEPRCECCGCRDKVFEEREVSE